MYASALPTQRRVVSQRQQCAIHDEEDEYRGLEPFWGYPYFCTWKCFAVETLPEFIAPLTGKFFTAVPLQQFLCFIVQHSIISCFCYTTLVNLWRLFSNCYSSKIIHLSLTMIQSILSAFTSSIISWKAARSKSVPGISIVHFLPLFWRSGFRLM